MKITNKKVKENPVVEKKDVKLTVSHEGESTPAKEDLISKYSAYEGIDKENIELDGIYSHFGAQKSVVNLRVPLSTETDQPLEQEPKEEEEPKEESEETGKEAKEKETKPESENVNYEELVSNTISDAKKEIKKINDPSFDKILEAEKENKNRKTFVSWLEDQQ